MSIVEVIEFEPDFDLDLDEDLDEPRRWCVILHNDDHTPMDFVVMLLREIFHHTEETAVTLMMDIHLEGAGVAGTYTHEIAEEKCAHATFASRDNGFPLVITIEPEEPE